MPELGIVLNPMTGKRSGVRSRASSPTVGFDHLIQALDLKPGDEMIFSAFNVKGMVRVVRDQGLVPIPVDLDLSSMARASKKRESNQCLEANA